MKSRSPAKAYSRFPALMFGHGAVQLKRDRPNLWVDPIFVFGTGGSGTRAVANVLSRTHWMGGAVYEGTRDSIPGAVFLRRWLVPYLDAGPSRKMLSDFKRALAVHRKGMPDRRGAWGIKNPRLIYLLPFLSEAFPASRFVHVFRDGRDMALSKNQLQLDDLGDHVLETKPGESREQRSMRLWAVVNGAAADHGDSLGARYMRLQFEDLVGNPVDTAGRLFGFLGVSSGTDVGDLVRDPGSIGRWRGAIDPHDVPPEALACLARLGYPTDLPG